MKTVLVDFDTVLKCFSYVRKIKLTSILLTLDNSSTRQVSVPQ